jgi:hypothetical protein
VNSTDGQLQDDIQVSVTDSISRIKRPADLDCRDTASIRGVPRKVRNGTLTVEAMGRPPERGEEKCRHTAVHAFDIRPSLVSHPHLATCDTASVSRFHPKVINRASRKCPRRHANQTRWSRCEVGDAHSNWPSVGGNHRLSGLRAASDASDLNRRCRRRA